MKFPSGIILLPFDWKFLARSFLMLGVGQRVIIILLI
jgi:hypothetical protein